MIPTLWTDTIYGGIAMVTDDCLVTAPRFGDGDWRGGHWAKIDKRTGSPIWRRKHRRGAAVFDRIGSTIIATTHKYSGVYAISLSTGRRLWSRLGDRFDWLLKCCEYLPCDNEGDGPEHIWNGGVLTRSGRLLDAQSGRIVSRHELKYSDSGPRMLVAIDGEYVPTRPRLRNRESIDLYKQDVGQIAPLLAAHQLCVPGWNPCFLRAHQLAVCLACKPPRRFLENPELRIAVGGSSEEVPHYLVVMDDACSQILQKQELGIYYDGEIDWADDNILSVTTQTRRQWHWSYQRQMWVLEWSALRRLSATRRE